MSVEGVRPEILDSWLRCRDSYGVDPELSLAAGATDHDEHHLEHDVLFTELGAWPLAQRGRSSSTAGSSR